METRLSRASLEASRFQERVESTWERDAGLSPEGVTFEQGVTSNCRLSSVESHGFLCPGGDRVASAEERVSFLQSLGHHDISCRHGVRLFCGIVS